MNHLRLFHTAQAAGLAAGEAATPTPMTVCGVTYADGMCGFASVRVKGNTSFGKWLVASENGHKSCAGGVLLWISEHGQSYARKLAHAEAMAGVLRAAGVDARVESNLD